jgi:hypothetical protein
MCMGTRHHKFQPQRNGERVFCRGEQSSKMIHDREGPPILIWHRWLPSSFENVLFFLPKYYANISWSQKRHVSDFLTRNSGSKVSSSMGFAPAHPEQNMKVSRVVMSHQLIEILQHCQATYFLNFLTGTSRGSSWSIPIIVWCLDRVQRWGPRNVRDKN